MVNYDKWERSYKICLMVIKYTIPMTIRGAMPDKVSAKSFLTEVADRFTKSDKVEASTHLSKLVNISYNGKGNIREYIIEMSNLVSKLKALKLELSEEILVHFILISLPPQYNPFKINYNAQRKKWSLTELISHCVQEEERLKQEKTESARLAFQGNTTNKKRKKSETKGRNINTTIVADPKWQKCRKSSLRSLHTSSVRK